MSIYMFTEYFVVVFLTMDDKEEEEEDCQDDDNPSPQPWQEEKKIPIHPPQKRELCCSTIENKVKGLQNLLAVRLQLQSVSISYSTQRGHRSKPDDSQYYYTHYVLRRVNWPLFTGPPPINIGLRFRGQ